MAAIIFTGCTPSINETAERVITPYQRIHIDGNIGYLEYALDDFSEAIQFKILEDYWVTDEEFQEAYDALVLCLAPHNITLNQNIYEANLFLGKYNLGGPDHKSQDWYQRDAKTDAEKMAAINEAMNIWQDCSLKTTDTLVEIYAEQTLSQDGRDHNIRLRDALVACGSTQYDGLSSEEVARAWKSEGIDFLAMDECLTGFHESESL